MKSFLLLAAGCILAFAGCERHPVSQVEALNRRDEPNPEKKAEPAQEQTPAPAEAPPSPLPRAYFPTDSR
ncbi:MAG: hypothetical protein JO069_05675 [Verrucomicrobia bacterium]|nr:hypothetical protein [Verrucomicrobiota bacterium]